MTILPVSKGRRDSSKGLRLVNFGFEGLTGVKHIRDVMNCDVPMQLCQAQSKSLALSVAGNGVATKMIGANATPEPWE
jgi:hypothetical protein